MTISEGNDQCLNFFSARRVGIGCRWIVSASPITGFQIYKKQPGLSAMRHRGGSARAKIRVEKVPRPIISG
jgi:hypothetical protein